MINDIRKCPLAIQLSVCFIFKSVNATCLQKNDVIIMQSNNSFEATGPAKGSSGATPGNELELVPLLSSSGATPGNQLEVGPLLDSSGVTLGNQLELGPLLGSSDATNSTELELGPPLGSSGATSSTELKLRLPLGSSGATPGNELELGPPLGKTFTSEELDAALQDILSRAGDRLLQVNLHHYLGNIDAKSSDKGIWLVTIFTLFIFRTFYCCQSPELSYK